MGSAQTTLGDSGTYGGIVSCAHVNITGTATGANHTLTTLATYTLPANVMDAGPNNCIRIKAMGGLAATANSKIVSIVFGGTALVSASNAVNDGKWIFEAYIGGTATQQVSCQSLITSGSTGTIDKVITGTNSMAEDGTLPIVVSVKAQNDSADAASDITFKLLVIEYMNNA